MLPTPLPNAGSWRSSPWPDRLPTGMVIFGAEPGGKQENKAALYNWCQNVSKGSFNTDAVAGYSRQGAVTAYVCFPYVALNCQVL